MSRLVISVCLVACASSLPLGSASFGVGQTAAKAPVVWQDYSWLMRAPSSSDVGKVAAHHTCAPPPPAPNPNPNPNPNPKTNPNPKQSTAAVTLVHTPPQLRVAMLSWYCAEGSGHTDDHVCQNHHFVQGQLV